MSDPSKKARKSRGSLSSIGNQSSRMINSDTDIKHASDVAGEDEKVSACEALTWNIIDREIFEWQYVCRTGRPYWWSTGSEYIRLRKLQAVLSNDNEPPRSRSREIETCRNDLYNRKRRAISDSFLAGQNCVEDLARLVAVQLLGSCFTLPPDHSGQIEPDYSCYNFNSPLSPPDSQLISSLRMHTQFRCSPCFGYQARNTSPAQCWSGAYDGPFPSLSPPSIEIGLHTLDDQQEECTKAAGTQNLNPEASKGMNCRHHGVDDDSARAMHRSQRNTTRQRPKPMHTDNDTCMPEGYRGVKVQSSSKSPTTNYRLQPMIRSEPHPVFVQPVKELVVKRWKTFRRRFGGSLHAYSPAGWEENLTEDPTPGHSTASSPAMSSDGKSRRRRAQERGHIHSSVDSTPLYNSPASGYDTPEGSSFPRPFWVDSINASPASQLADPLAAAAALALADTQAGPVQSPNSISPNLSTPSESFASSSQCGIPLDSNGCSQPTIEVRIAAKSTPDPATSSYTNRTRKRQHRRSMLSEMHTPEDFAENIASEEAPKEPVERGLLSAAGSDLPTPQEEAESDIGLVVHSEGRESIGNLGPVGALSVRRMTVSSDTRLSLGLSRTSTSGTQVYTPSDDAVEIDGLPASPSKEVWNSIISKGTGKRRARTYL